MSPRRPQDRTAEEKLKIVIEAETLPEEQLGAFLRRNAVHEAQLQEWRNMMLSGLKPSRLSPKSSEENRKIRELEQELQRKEKALAEAAALLLLKKKVHSIWGGEDESTDQRSGR